MAQSSPDVLSTVAQGFVEEFSQGSYAITELLDKWKSAGGIVQKYGSELITPLNLKKHSVGTAIVSGSTKIKMSTQGIAVKGRSDWARAVQPVLLPKRDKIQHGGPEAKVDYIQELLASSLQDFMMSLEDKLVANSDPDDLFPDLISFNGVSGGLGAGGTGIFENAAFGSQSNSIAGVDKGDHIDTYQHQYFDMGGDFATNKQGLYETINLCRFHNPKREWPHLVLASQAGYAQYLSSLTDNQRFANNQGGTTDSGFQYIKVMGTDMCFHPGLPSAIIDPDAADVISFYILNLKSLRLNYSEWFKPTPWMDMFQAELDAEGMYYTVEVQTSASHLPSCGLIVNGDA